MGRPRSLRDVKDSILIYVSATPTSPVPTSSLYIQQTFPQHWLCASNCLCHRDHIVNCQTDMILPLKSLVSSRQDRLENTSFKVILLNILIAVPETKQGLRRRISVEVWAEGSGPFLAGLFREWPQRRWHLSWDSHDEMMLVSKVGKPRVLEELRDLRRQAKKKGFIKQKKKLFPFLHKLHGRHDLAYMEEEAFLSFRRMNHRRTRMEVENKKLFQLSRWEVMAAWAK